MAFTIKVNGNRTPVDVDGDTPLLWVLRDVLGMTGTKFGCGVALCGACTVHVDGAADALLRHAGRQHRRQPRSPRSRRSARRRGQDVQQAWLDLDVVQCGYCQSGQIMSAAALLARQRRSPTDADIDAAMSGNICRCGTYQRIRAAITRAAAREATGHELTAMADHRNSLSIARSVPARPAPPLGGGLLLDFAPPPALRPRARSRRSAGFAPNAFIRIDREGVVTLVMPHGRDGAGHLHRACRCCSPRSSRSVSTRSGSSTPRRMTTLYANPLLRLPGDRRLDPIRAFWMPLRQAGAAARTMLVAAAAKQLGGRPRRAAAPRTAPSCTASGPRARLWRAGRRRGDAAGAATKRRAEGPEGLHADRHAGQAARRTGQGRRHGRVRHRRQAAGHEGRDDRASRPVFGGKLEAVDDSDGAGGQGRAPGRQLDEAVAVVADHMGAAKKGLEALAIAVGRRRRTPTSTRPTSSRAARSRRRRTPGVVARKRGRRRQGAGRRGATIDAVYQMPFLAHAAMEPMNCTVHVRKDGCEIWVGTQVAGARRRRWRPRLTGLPLTRSGPQSLSRRRLRPAARARRHRSAPSRSPSRSTAR